jgi:hypothetical protein
VGENNPVGLSDEQIKEFREEGYLFFQSALEYSDVARLQQEASRILELVVNAMRYHDRQSRRLNIVESSGGEQVALSLLPFFDLSLTLRRFGQVFIPRILDQLIDGNSVALSNLSQLNYKQTLPTTFDFEFHQSEDEWPPHSDWRTFEGWGPERMAVSVVFIDECTEKNGALSAWPGTHTERFNHVVKDSGPELAQEARDELDDREKVTFTGEEGSILLFDSRLIHSSSPNRSDGSRRLLTYRHAPDTNVEAEVKKRVARPQSPHTGYPKPLAEAPYEQAYLTRDGGVDEDFDPVRL